MLHGLGIPWFGPLFGPHFSQFVWTRMGVLGIDTFSRACSFPGSFWACAGPIVGPQGVSYVPWPGYHLVWTAFWAAFFHTLCGQEWGAGIDTFSGACSFLGSFRPCAGPQGVNYALWPR